MRAAAAAGSVLLLVVCSGCAAFRAEVGYGLGVGAIAKVPYVIHGGEAIGIFKHIGHNYSDGWREGDTGGTGQDWDVEVAILIVCKSHAFIGHLSWSRSPFQNSAPGTESPEHHECRWLAPSMAEPDHAESYGFEISLFLLLVDIRLGFNPWYWKYGDHWSPEPLPEEEDDPEEEGEAPEEASPA